MENARMARASVAAEHGGDHGLQYNTDAAEQYIADALAPDLAEAERFLTLLDETAEKYRFRVIRPDGHARKFDGRPEDLAGELTRENAAGAGIFVVVNAGGHKDADIVKVRAVFADLDGAPIEPVYECRLEPHLVIESSSGRWHAYWLVAGLDLDRFEGVQRALAERFDGDASVHNLSRVMRLPGFYHCKGEPHLVRIVHDSGAQPYTAEQVLAEFPPSTTDGGGKRRERLGAIAASDPVVGALNAQGRIKSHRHDGGYNINCPFEAEHTTDSTETSTVYWPAHTGGFATARIHCAHAHCVGRTMADYRDALGLDSPAAGAFDDLDSGHSLVIRIAAGELPRMVHAGIHALRQAGQSIYARGGQLVRPVRLDVAEESDQGIRRPRGATILAPVRASWLRLRLSEAAEWQRYVRREQEWIPADPPREVAEAIAATPDEADWPVLRAIVRTPVVWPDGTWSGRPGYQRGLYLDIAGGWPEPGTTRQDAEGALATLRHHYRHMAWASEQDEAAGLSLVLTAIQRPTMDSAPMHAIDAPTAGSGKSLFNDSASILATGTRAAVMDYGRDPVEASKRLDSMLLAGDSVIAIDNVEAPLEGATLCQTLTQPVRKIRLLGTHDSYVVPCTALITATGNNLTIRGDLVRRTIVCRLDARTERPDTREIGQDLIAETFERRAELAVAAQTILRAYILAGRPKVGLRPLGLFDEWSETVRAALVWLGLPDPAGTVDRAMADDPSRQELHAVFTAWHTAFGSEPMSAAGAIQRAEFDQDLLHDALAAICTRKGGLDSRALGYWLRRNRDARSGGLVLTRHPPYRGYYRWEVSPDRGGDSGDSGDVSLLDAGVGMPNAAVAMENMPPMPTISTKVCPECNGDGCGWCGDTGRHPDAT